jgi:hypothetical protein
MTRSPVSSFCLAVLLGAAPLPLIAQQAATAGPGRADGRVWVEGYVSRFSLDAGAGERAGLDGIGGRVLWPLAPSGAGSSHPLLARAAVGAFVTHTPASLGRLEAWHLGTQADLHVLARPVRAVDPVVSLGVGALRKEETVARPVVLPGGAQPLFAAQGDGHAPERMALERRHETRMTLAPGVGVKVRIAPGLALRTDVRDVLALRGGAEHHLEVSGGISVAR